MSLLTVSVKGPHDISILGACRKRWGIVAPAVGQSRGVDTYLSVPAVQVVSLRPDGLTRQWKTDLWNSTASVYRSYFKLRYRRRSAAPRPL